MRRTWACERCNGNDPSIVLQTTRGGKAAESIRSMIDQIPPNVRRELVTIGQPVWWVARGLVGGGALFGVTGASAVAVVGALAGAAVSVWVGRKTQQDRRWLWYVVPLNLVAAILVPALLAFGFTGIRSTTPPTAAATGTRAATPTPPRTA